MQKRLWIGLSAMTLLSACFGYEGDDIQKQYAADRDECRDYAQSTTAGGEDMMPTGREHILLVAQFGRCMNKRGWAVNKPPEDVTANAQKATGSSAPAK